MSDDSYTRGDVDSWLRVIELLHANAVADVDARVVSEAVANISSGAGLVHSALPAPLLTLVHETLEAGYGHALRDVRDGRIAGLGPTDA